MFFAYETGLSCICPNWTETYVMLSRLVLKIIIISLNFLLFHVYWRLSFMNIWCGAIIFDTGSEHKRRECILHFNFQISNQPLLSSPKTPTVIVFIQKRPQMVIKMLAVAHFIFKMHSKRTKWSNRKHTNHIAQVRTSL